MLSFRAIASLMLLLVAVRAGASVQATKTGDRTVIENTQIRVTIDAHGGRISSLINKSTGKDLICMWTIPGEIGGALDDRLAFTSILYRVAVDNRAGKESVVRMEAQGPLGVGIRKTIAVRGDEPTVRVHYEFSNGSQQSQALWVRNFFMPGGPPITDHHSYTLPRRDGLSTVPVAGDMYEDLAAPWVALFNSATHEGVLVAAPGEKDFYFWQGSKIFPTFEWIYADVPAGKRLNSSVAIDVVNSGSPDWNALAKPLLTSTPGLALDAVPGWVDEATRFRVTRAERERGFWLSTGVKDGKQRLPQRVEIDLPQDAERAYYIGINMLADVKGAQVSARADGDATPALKTGFEHNGGTAITVDPLVGPVEADLAKGTEYRLWIDAGSRGRSPGVYSGNLTLAIGERRALIPISLHIWPVRVPDSRPFDVRGYSMLNYSAEPESLRTLEQVFADYALMGGTVLDWPATDASILAHIRIASSGKSLVETADSDPVQISLDALPDLDFSYFDPCLDIAKRHGATRIETYLEFLDGGWQTGFLDSVTGKGRVKAGGPEAERVIAWFLAQTRSYFERHAFRGYFCKISDEMPPENVGRYIETAKLARRGGWRPFSTITMMIGRSPELVNQLLPYCDQWQLSVLLKDDFQQLIQGPNAAVHLKPDDEVWYYAGVANPYKNPYETTFGYPLLAAARGDRGYGFWAFQFGLEAVVWPDPKASEARIGPAFLGLRDGWQDARLFSLAVRERHLIPEAKAISDRPGALLRLGDETVEVYHLRAITNLQSPAAINAARRTLLKALATKAR